jgi:hypothetical protein
MLPHCFSHDGATYVVSFRQVDGQWCAALYRRGDTSVRHLPRFTEAKGGGFSEVAIRQGYIAVATAMVTLGLGSQSQEAPPSAFVRSPEPHGDEKMPIQQWPGEETLAGAPMERIENHAA